MARNWQNNARVTTRTANTLVTGWGSQQSPIVGSALRLYPGVTLEGVRAARDRAAENQETWRASELDNVVQHIENIQGQQERERETVRDNTLTQEQIQEGLERHSTLLAEVEDLQTLLQKDIKEDIGNVAVAVSTQEETIGESRIFVQPYQMNLSSSGSDISDFSDELSKDLEEYSWHTEDGVTEEDSPSPYDYGNKRMRILREKRNKRRLKNFLDAHLVRRIRLGQTLEAMHLGETALGQTDVIIPKTLAQLQNEHVWIADTGATVHSTPYGNGLFNERMVTAEDTITVASGTTLIPETVGCLKMQIYDKSGTLDTKLNPVVEEIHHIKKGVYNLWSISKSLSEVFFCLLALKISKRNWRFI